jgi:hypothetical protein
VIAAKEKQCCEGKGINNGRREKIPGGILFSYFYFPLIFFVNYIIGKFFTLLGVSPLISDRKGALRLLNKNISR